MKAIKTEITIEAPVEKVWNVLMNHEEYPKWNPFIKEMSGDMRLGQTISVTLHPEGKSSMKFTPLVLKNEKNHEFRWLGHLFVKGLFDGEHYFKLKALSPHQTRLIHGEQFTGILVNVLLKLIGESTINGFQAMNEALKRRLELKTHSELGK